MLPHAPRIVTCLLASAFLPAGEVRPAEPDAAPKNLVHNGDFELPATGVPAGWRMWGASAYKDPRNYTRDTDRPHGGKACLRIHHPADTAGYIVTSPDHAIAVREGMMYVVSFWARADAAGGSLFRVQGYKSFSPYVGARAPGESVLQVGTQWKRFTFTFHEGWDFFAAQARYLLLDFKATGERSAARTLWIDDVVVHEMPSTRRGRLLDGERMDYRRLEHRLAKGDRLAFAVDPARRIGRTNPMVGGVSFHRVAGWAGLPYDKEGNYVMPGEIEQAIRQMRLPMTRFYAVGDEAFPLASSIDKAADVCRRVGVPLAAVPLEFEVQGSMRSLPPAVWAGGVTHSLRQGYGFQRWEICNEPYVPHEPMAFPTAEKYAEHFKAVAKAIRSAHPGAKIGLSINPRDHDWGQALLVATAGHYDWIAPHYYCFIHAYRSEFEDVVLTGNYHVIDLLCQTRHMLEAHNPGRTVTQYDTEWGLHSRGPNDERAGLAWRNGNVYGTLHRAVRLILYAREDLLEGASSWEMFSTDSTPGFGFFSKASPKARHMMYWLYYYFNRHVGHWALQTDGTAPYHTGTYRGVERSGPLTPVLAALDADGKTLRLVIANGSWKRPVPCEVTLHSYQPHRAVGITLAHDDPDGHPRSERREDFVRDLTVRAEGGKLTFTVPAHAVVFITVEGDVAGGLRGAASSTPVTMPTESIPGR